MKPAELVGHSFDRLRVVSLVETTRSGRLWECACVCGGSAQKLTTQLKRTTNIGCKSCEPISRSFRHLKHGDARGSSNGAKTKLYMVWKGMRSRCRDKGNTSYRFYGAKGVKVSEEWATFAAFKEWALASGYSQGLSIDRLDPSGDYAPSNCEWVTKSENSKRMLAHRRSL